MKRMRHNAMEIIDAPIWLVVEDKYARPLKIMQLPPLTDPRRVMIEQMARSLEMGFVVEELPGSIPHYFCRRGDPEAVSFERHFVSITSLDPADRGTTKYSVAKPGGAMPFKPK